MSLVYFDETKNRLITFIGKSFENTSKQNSYVLLGDLTMKGITNQIKLDVVFDGKMTDPYGNQKSGYTINGTINRKKWGLNWNGLLEAGGVVVSEEVKICCEVQLIKQL